MKFLTLTAGTAPLLLLPTLFGSPLPQDVAAQGDCAQAPRPSCDVPKCEDSSVAAAPVAVAPVAQSASPASCSAKAIAKAPSQHECEGQAQEQSVSARAAGTVALLQGDGKLVPVSTNPRSQTTTSGDHITALHSLLRSQGDSAFSNEEEVILQNVEVETSDDGTTRWVRVGQVDSPHTVVLKDVHTALTEVSEAVPKVADSLEQALNTISESLSSGELQSLLHDGAEGLQVHLHEALNALHEAVEHHQAPHATGHGGGHAGGQAKTITTTRTRVGKLDPFDNVVEWTTTEPHIVIQSSGSSPVEIRGDDVGGVIARVVNELGIPTELRSKVIRLAETHPEPPAPIAPAPPVRSQNPRVARVQPMAPPARAHDPEASDIAQILSEMRAEMREMRASMAELRDQLEAERSRSSRARNSRESGFRGR